MVTIRSADSCSIGAVTVLRTHRAKAPLARMIMKSSPVKRRSGRRREEVMAGSEGSSPHFNSVRRFRGRQVVLQNNHGRELVRTSSTFALRKTALDHHL